MQLYDVNEVTRARPLAIALASRFRFLAGALSVLLLACGHDTTVDRRSPAAVRDTSSTHEATAAGEVVVDSAAHSPTTSVRWITDANALALVTALNAREKAAVEV